MCGLMSRRAFVVLMIATLTATAYAPAGASTDSVSLDTARAEHEAGRALLIDIREPSEHATGVVAGARLLPMGQISARIAEIPNDPAQPVLLICNTQNRSSAALRSLRQQGFGNVRFVQGGMSEWARRGWPMVLPGR
jgi:rhodanese-related sulfurtransferase